MAVVAPTAAEVVAAQAAAGAEAAAAAALVADEPATETGPRAFAWALSGAKQARPHESVDGRQWAGSTGEWRAPVFAMPGALAPVDDGAARGRWSSGSERRITEALAAALLLVVLHARRAWALPRSDALLAAGRRFSSPRPSAVPRILRLSLSLSERGVVDGGVSGFGLVLRVQFNHVEALPSGLACRILVVRVHLYIECSVVDHLLGILSDLADVGHHHAPRR